MSEQLAVGVSERTLSDLGTMFRPWLRLVCADDPDVSILWRRQTDRTSWVIEAIAQLPRLQWLHTDTAGIDRLPLDELSSRGVLVTNARGIHAVAVSEWALAAILTAAKRFDEIVRRSDRREWAFDANAHELADRTVVILGVGSIGTALARACSGLGMRVVGVSRTRRPRPYLDRHVSVLDRWIDELPQASFLVNCLPLTPATRNLVDEIALARLPTGAWFVNIGRGETVDEDALVRVVSTGTLGGAILDTVTNEPLDCESKLWGHPNIIVGSHRSSFTDRTSERTVELFIAEARRYGRGDPLVNVVNLNEGY
ncbi:D-2-hydroxyacid dehydrogenase [Nocardia sp. CA-135953]|uniref:D-2-hydroxyacid dehydrogenase n=1 Tax=Nocardia sp. CA-135953 TaxID=3239978 RepID=UPI003D95EDD5